MSEPANSSEEPLSKAPPAPSKSGNLGGKKNIREIDVNTLFNGDREIAILHRGESYKLRITANDKLILTK
ncbi:hemin uptake protein HemP [Microvirga sp. W0021]|uniref:Hemin uptake protein HemP n=1 Tax=Hohaiivirga grylli TaxID=3133970 RepID=A0ABV0BLW1_9HYPH